MKKFSALVLSAIIFVIAFVFGGCNVRLDGNGGDIVSNATALPTPEITEVKNNYVFWNEVPNADSYVVKINSWQESVGNVLKYSISSILDAHLSDAEEIEIHIYVKAKGNSILYADSEWSNEYVTRYIKNSDGDKTQGGESGSSGGTYLQTGVGYSIDVISAKNYNDYKKGVSVLDRTKLTNASFDKSLINYNAPQTHSATSVNDLISKTSITTDISVDSKINVFGFFNNISVGLSSGISFDYQSYSSKYYYTLDHYIARYSLSLVDYAEEGVYSNYLSATYLTALDKLLADDSEENIIEFYQKYGTHLIGSAVFGGRLNVYFSTVTNEAKIDNSFKSKLDAKIDFGLQNVGNTSVGIKNEISEVFGENAKDIEMGFSAVAYGGNAFGSSSIDDFNNNYKVWWNSFNEDTDNSVLVNCSDDGLLPLWDLLPEKYIGLQKAMKKAFITYYNGAFDKFIDKFESELVEAENTKDYAGGNGSESNPYKIATLEHLLNIEKNMGSNFKLVEDIDAGTIVDWNSLGGFYLDNSFNGVLDGDGHKIKNLSRSNYVAEKNHRSYFGLFGCVGEYGLVKNIIFEDLNIEINRGKKYDDTGMRAFFGVVAGKCCGKIENVELLSGKFIYYCGTNGETFMGGICGYLFNGEIRNCINRVNISATRNSCVAGGMVAYAAGGNISYCENFGNIYTKSDCTGGMSYAGCIAAVGHLTNPTLLNGNTNSGKPQAHYTVSASKCKTSILNFATSWNTTY